MANISLDFDGTCVAFDYPNIGKDIGAIPVLKELVEEGHQLILFTMRSDWTLNAAVKWFKDNEIPLWGIQTNPEQHEWTSSPKCYADLIIDDSALGVPLKFDSAISKKSFVDWEKIRELLVKENFLK